jgi:phage/plasmid-like protein (TIGR03299 family)
MSDYFESGFFVRERAWHGLGTVLPEAPELDDALRIAGLDWTVRTVESFAHVNGEHVPAPDARHVVRQIGDRVDVLGTVGTRFTPLQNSDAFQWFAPLVHERDVELEAAGSVKGGKHVWVLAKISGVADVAVGRPDDIVRPYLLLSNAHDGTRAVSLAFTPIRVVCWNTLSAANAAAAADAKRGGNSSASIRHTASMEANLALARDQIALAERAFSAKAEIWQELAKAQIPSADEALRYTRTVFARPDDAKRIDAMNAERAPVDKLPEVRAERHVARLLRSGPGADSAGLTWWGAYQAATHYVDHVRASNPDRALASTWFGAGASVRDRAESVAVAFAGV